MKRTMIFALAATLAGAGGAAGQEADGAAAMPTCAEQGTRRLIVMVPPGRNEAEMQELVRKGALAPAGTEVFVIPGGHFTRMKNQKEFGERLSSMLHGFMVGGLKVDGTVGIVIQLDADGAVALVNPGTGNRRLDRELTRIWREAEFEPYHVGGCRVPAWINAPLAFTSDLNWTHGRMEVKPVQP
jgi:hypothetical protein